MLQRIWAIRTTLRGKSDYVYMKLFPEDNIEPLGISPMSTDMVSVHYRGKFNKRNGLR